MRTIAITNLKGGVGKTTTAVNLGAALAAKLAPRGERVLILDLDAQVHASASAWLGAEPSGTAFLDALQGEGELGNLVTETTVDGLDLIPGSRSLARAEVVLASEPGSELVLRACLQKLPELWEIVLLDLPPAQGWVLHSGLAAATDVLLPIESGAMALGSLFGLDEVVNKVRDRLNPNLRLFGVLQCRADARTRLYHEIDRLLHEQFPDDALDTIIRSDVKLLEAPAYKQDILAYAPRSRAANDFRALADEVGKRLGLAAFAD